MGKIEEIRKMIEDYLHNSTFTSASPGFTNVARDVIYTFEPDPAEFDDAGEPLDPTQPIKAGSESAFLPGSTKADLLSLQNIQSGPSGLLSKLGGLAKLVPVISAIVLAPTLVKKLADFLRAPGMPFDVRFKRDIQNEVLQSFERDQKAKIRQGVIFVRITSSPTLRGENGIGQTGQVGITGMARYDMDFEAFKKLGVAP